MSRALKVHKTNEHTPRFCITIHVHHMWYAFLHFYIIFSNPLIQLIVNKENHDTQFIISFLVTPDTKCIGFHTSTIARLSYVAGTFYLTILPIYAVLTINNCNDYIRRFNN